MSACHCGVLPCLCYPKESSGKMSEWCKDIEIRKRFDSIKSEWVDDKWIISYDVVPHYWKFCPICQAPRPRPVEREKLIKEKINDVVNGVCAFVQEKSYCMFKNEPFQEVGIRPEDGKKRLLAIAEEHFNESKKS